MKPMLVEVGGSQNYTSRGGAGITDQGLTRGRPMVDQGWTRGRPGGRQGQTM